MNRASFFLFLLIFFTQTDAAAQLRMETLVGETAEVMELTPDTGRLNFARAASVEGQGIAVAYPANNGAPVQSRIFSERPEPRDFIFVDPLKQNLLLSPRFFDTKIPRTDILYTFNGGEQRKEERLKALLTWNFGKRLNVGGEVDYIYSRGHYRSNGNKTVSYRLFGSFLTDRYEARAYLGNCYFVTAENGGLTNDDYITHPERFTDGRRAIDSKAFPVRFFDVFNTVREKQYFLAHRYNLGAYRPHDDTLRFVPVASIGHRFIYIANRRHFTATDISAVDTCYPTNYAPLPAEGEDDALHDRPAAVTLANTFSLSLREGFRDWVKFGLAAFVRFEQRRFTTAGLSDNGTILPADLAVFKEFSTYVGGEWSKRRGRYLTYNASGEICLLGDDIGEFRLAGDIRTTLPLAGSDATLVAEAYLRNLTPAFFLRHYRSRYFVWDAPLPNEQQAYVGGTVDIPATRTRLSAGVHSLQNHTYVDASGYPACFDGNIQVLSARLAQSFRFGVFGWENEAVAQQSSQSLLLPLPLLCLYTNLYADVKPVPVLSLQLGCEAYWFTAYNAPYYEPATMLFRLQDTDEAVSVGNFPLVNAYANFHLKQARFFVAASNLASLFLTPEYFSLPHYPLNPFLIKFGIAVHLND
ncbi:MAG: putative porin [Tannerellaceae bacterium]|jgi:hypothetical protein|nr:putative porin [Tannerellaceae bacterium]